MFSGLAGDRQRACERFLRAIPLANQDQVHSQVVVAIGGVILVVSSLVITDRLFEKANAFLRSFHKPASAGHVAVNLAEQEGGRMIADELQRLAKVFQRRFVLTFMDVGRSETEVRFSQPAPIARLSITLQSAMRVVAPDRIFTDAAINACQGGVHRADLYAFFR